MQQVVKKYSLNDDQQANDSKAYWQQQTIAYKLEVLESLREDAVKLGLYPEVDETEPRLRRIYKITSQI